MALSLEEQLANLEAAIVKAENAQSYSVGGRSVSYGNLEAMYRRRDQLEQRITRASTGMFTVAKVDRPT